MRYLYVCSSCLEGNFKFTPSPKRQTIPVQIISMCKHCKKQRTFLNGAHDLVVGQFQAMIALAEQETHKVKAARKKVMRVQCKTGCGCITALAELKAEVAALRSSGAIASRES